MNKNIDPEILKQMGVYDSYMEIQQFAQKAKLKKLENRAIIDNYTSANDARYMEFVYAPLMKSFPSLSTSLDAAGKLPKKNPIDDLGEMQSLLAQFKFSPEEREYFKLLSNSAASLFNKIESIAPILDNVYTVWSDFYSNLIDTTKQFSQLYSIDIKTVFDTQDNFDKIFRLTLPNKTSAKEFFSTEMEFKQAGFDFLQLYIPFAKSIGEPSVDDLKTPSKKAFTALMQATMDYKLSEFDRIYSNK